MGSALATTRLADGRVQLFVCTQNSSPRVFTAWQTSLDPTVPWTPLTRFEPDPGETFSIAASSSPEGGRCQLWTNSVSGLRTTWKETMTANSGWESWTPFAHDPAAGINTVGCLPDGRMQLWGTDDQYRIWTTWKVTSETDAAWSPWTQFNPGQTGIVLAAGNLSDGRLQIWAVVRSLGVGGPYGPLMSAWKTTTNPDSVWTPWQEFFLPSGATAYSEAATAAQGPGGRLQLWAFTSDGVLQSTAKTSADPNAAWSPWQNPFEPNPGSVVDVTAAQLRDTRLQLWALTPPAADGTAQVLTSQMTSPTPGAAWTPWSSIGSVG
jgi:hypothetical protein